jgi:TRAP-type C4-dicarboxylate transport system permease small subunit
MNQFTKFVDLVVNANKKIAFVAMVIMMLAVTVFSLSRTLGFAMIGNIEIIQFLMVLLIVGSLAFTEKENSHISIGIIVDHFPSFIQRILNLIAYTLLFVFCALIVWSIIVKIDFAQASSLLRIPYFPFKILIIIGFFAWGLEAMRKIINTISQFKTDN